MFSGVCPTELSGKRVGVFIATGVNETHKLLYSLETKGSGLMGFVKYYRLASALASHRCDFILF